MSDPEEPNGNPEDVEGEQEENDVEAAEQGQRNAAVVSQGLPDDNNAFISNPEAAFDLIEEGFKPTTRHGNGFFMVRQQDGLRYNIRHSDPDFYLTVRRSYDDRLNRARQYGRPPRDESRLEAERDLDREQAQLDRGVRTDEHNIRMDDKRRHLLENESLAFQRKDPDKPFMVSGIRHSSDHMNSIIEIGEMTFHILMQYYKLGPNESIWSWLDRLEKKNGVHDWFKDTLSDLLAAAQNPHAITALRRRCQELEIQLEVSDNALEAMKLQSLKERHLREMAVSAMCPADKMKLASVNLMLGNYPVQQPAAPGNGQQGAFTQ